MTGMNRMIRCGVAAAAVTLIGVGAAQSQQQQEGESLRDLYSELRQKLTERYDKDGDGELSREERGAMFEQARKEREAEMVKRYDKDGDGQLSDAERQSIRDEWQERASEWRAQAEKRRELEQWDKDGDGILSDSEKAAKEAAEKAEAERLAKSNAEVIAKYDTNGDGQLDNKEVEAMKAKVAEMVNHLKAVEELAETFAAEKPTLLREVEGVIRTYKSTRGRDSRWGGRGGDRDRVSRGR